ncbi:MAG TPA: hypothetical protein PKE00_12195 [Planctomycetota bacterium]|nr:hypothetical protein [Planctomycetota bacterium]
MHLLPSFFAAARLRRAATACLATGLTLCFVCCKAPTLTQLELGMRPNDVRARFGEPSRIVLAEREEGSAVRKILIEEYPSKSGHYFQLMYSVPLDIAELALQGDNEYAERLAPELLQGVLVANLDVKRRTTIVERSARLMRYREFERQADLGSTRSSGAVFDR